MTISDGLKKFTTPASIAPIRRPAAWSSSTATGSPNDAARATSSAVTDPRRSSAVAQPQAPALARRRLARRARSPRRRPAPRGSRCCRSGRSTSRSSDDLDVPDVAGRPLRAAVEPPVRDDPGADAGADLDDDDVVVAGGDARPPLAEREHVDVVVDPDRRVVAVREPLADRVAVPAGHDRRRDRPAGPELDRTGHADADAPQPPGQRRGVVASSWPNSSSTRSSATSGPSAMLGRLVVVAEDPAVERRHRDVDARSRRGRRPARGRRRRGTSAGAAAGRRCSGPGRPRRRARGRGARATRWATMPRLRPVRVDEVAARPRAAQPDLVEDGDERVERLVGERARGRCRGVADRAAAHGADHTRDPAGRSRDFCT